MKLFPALPVRGINGWFGAEIGDAVMIRRTQSTPNRTLYLHKRTAHGWTKVGFVRATEVPADIKDDAYYPGVVTFTDARSGKVIISDSPCDREPSPQALQKAGDVIHSYLKCYGTDTELVPDDTKARAAGLTVTTRDKPSLVRYVPETKLSIQTSTSKEETMNNTASRAFDRNKTAVATAAYLEGGKIANNKLAQVVAKSAPLMVRGYVDTPVGKLVLANLVSLAVSEAGCQQSPKLQAFVSKHPMLQELSQAMMTQAYVEAIGTMDLEGLLDKLLDSDEIKSAMSKLKSAEAS